MFLRCSYFLAKSKADVLINSVLRQNAACIGTTAADRSNSTGKSDAAACGTGATTAGEGGRKAENLQQATGSRRRLGMRPRH